MKKLQKSIRAIAAAMLMGATFSLTSCDVMLDVLGGMASGMAYYSPYGYTSSFGVSTNNNYLLDPGYAMWQADQQIKEMNRVNQQLIDLSIDQVNHGIYLGGTGGTIDTGSNGNISTPSTSKTKDCTHCDHSGKCGNCYGKGHHLVLGTDQKCTNCNGTGICPWCGGAGKR